MNHTRVLIVTDELYPFTAGGIGRIVHNLLVDSLARSPETELHVMMPPYVRVDPRQLQLYFHQKVRLHVCAYRKPDEPAGDEHGLYPLAESFTDARWHAESLDVLRALKALEREGLHFDVIEFPDFRGLAFCALQEKRLGRAFANTELVVRLHTTHGVLMHFEPSTLEMENLGRFEIERKALLDADRVIAHLPQIAEFNQRYYGFADSWARKVTLEFPPVVVGAPSGARTQPPPAVRDLVFVTKIQAIKQPELFVRAAALLMVQRPDYKGHAVLSCHAFDEAYLERVKRLVPVALRERFLFSKPGPEREALIRDGIVVVPSIFESLNLTAYEASVAGAVLIINGACPAFGERTPFVDGRNCLKFDGSVESLTAAMSRAIDGPTLEPVTWSVSRPHWEAPRVTQAPRRTAGPRPRVSVCITTHDEGRYLPELLASIASSTHPDVEVVVVDDGSSTAYDQVLLERLEEESRTEGSSVRLLRNPVHRGLATSRNQAIRAASGAYVLVLRAEDCIGSDFLGLAVDALERHPEFAGVVPTVGCFSSHDELAQRRFTTYSVPLGDTPSLSMIRHQSSHGMALLRREVLLAHPYDEGLEAYENWHLHLRLVHAGMRLLVTNHVECFHHVQPTGLTAEDSHRHFERVTRIYERLPQPLSAALRLSLLLTPLAVGHRELLALQSAVSLPTLMLGQEHRPLRYDFADMLNHAVKQLPLVHPLIKQAFVVARPPVNSENGELPLRYNVVNQFNNAIKHFSPLHTVIKRVAELSR